MHLRLITHWTGEAINVKNVFKVFIVLLKRVFKRFFILQHFCEQKR